MFASKFQAMSKVLCAYDSTSFFFFFMVAFGIEVSEGQISCIFKCGMKDC